MGGKYQTIGIDSLKKVPRAHLCIYGTFLATTKQEI